MGEKFLSSNQIKISVETEDGRRELCTLSNSETKTLDDTVKCLCNRFSLPSDTIYALKLLESNDGKLIDNYVTDENFGDIKDGYFLKIVYSLHIFIDRIFNNLYNFGREQSFKDLWKLSTDPAFINELVKKNKHVEVVRLLLEEDLNEFELEACLMTYLHLIQKNHVRRFEKALINKIVKLVLGSESQVENLKYAIAVLCQILYQKGHQFDEIKSHIITEVTIKELIPYICNEDQPSLQLHTLMLINAFVKCVRGEKRQRIICEMNLKQNKDVIYNYIIKNKVSQPMAYQLYVYQTYILSLHNNDLQTYVDTTSSRIFREEFELCVEALRPISNLIDFEDMVSLSRQNSMETILDSADDTRFSIASISTRESVATCNSVLSSNSSSSQENDSNDNRLSISNLALDGLCYYKKYHYKTFQQSLVEENLYKPGIYKTSEKITQMLAKILHIGREPDRNCIQYQPLIFDGNMKNSFFLELFARTMWLLSKTRREMKVSTLADYNKVLTVLEEQVRIILNKKLMDYTSLTKAMRKVSYTDVVKHWQSQKNNKWAELLENNPSVQEFKHYVTPANQKLIYEQRMSVLKAGGVFPKFSTKKTKTYIHMKLTENERSILYDDWDNISKQCASKDIKSFNVTSIKYIITGTACPHVKDNSVKDHSLAFTLQLEDNTVFNFQAQDQKMANYWIDGFHLLLDKLKRNSPPDNPKRSKSYMKELGTLVEMDCMLQLLELQNIKIPNSPPMVPPIPPAFLPKPALPPKPNLKFKTQKVIR